jgi:hypothetical protein
MDNAERFVRASRVSCVGKSWSGALRSAGDGPDVPSAVIESMNLSPASMNEVAASWTSLPLGGDANAGETPAGPDITAPPNFAGCHDHLPVPR